MVDCRLISTCSVSGGLFSPAGNGILKKSKRLLGDKEFSSRTTAKIAGNAGVNEALIYK